MAGKLKLVKGKPPTRSTLVYGMRLVGADEIAGVDDALIRTADGGSARVTMHLLEGTHSQIRRQLMQSIDAFFELFEEP
ncbi:MAG: allantoinase [Candidatus Binataceae bacterium]